MPWIPTLTILLEGYKILEMGPRKLEKMGAKECQETRERLMNADRCRCPFNIS